MGFLLGKFKFWLVHTWEILHEDLAKDAEDFKEILQKHLRPCVSLD